MLSALSLFVRPRLRSHAGVCLSFWRRLPAVLVLCVALALLACSPRAHRFVNTDITGSALKAQFELSNLQGQRVGMAHYQGRVVVMFFGFTQCPDICPTTLQQWQRVKNDLGPLGKDLQVVFVSLDPERDTPAVLRQYVPQFDSSFDALMGPTQDLDPLVKGLKVFYEKVPGKVPGQYTIDHTAASFVFDRQGQPRLLVRQSADHATLVADIRALLLEGQHN
jgi:protein SCO1